MWDYIIKKILKKEVQEKPNLHKINTLSYVEAYKETKINKKNQKERNHKSLEISKESSKYKRVLLCPVCNVVMEIKIYPSTNIEIDICPKCKGIFLDKGELKEITGYELEIQKSSKNDFLIYTPSGKNYLNKK
ncbi:MAG: zf-TFIIB domain-containing protein [Leptonema sp. (in: bacteria)]